MFISEKEKETLKEQLKDARSTIVALKSDIGSLCLIIAKYKMGDSIVYDAYGGYGTGSQELVGTIQDIYPSGDGILYHISQNGLNINERDIIRKCNCAGKKKKKKKK